MRLFWSIVLLLLVLWSELLIAVIEETVVEKDLYAVLGLKQTATTSEIKKAFRNLAKAHHPDKYMGNPEEKERNERLFLEIGTAYEVLVDTNQREEYDAMRKQYLRWKASGGHTGGSRAPDSRYHRDSGGFYEQDQYRQAQAYEQYRQAYEQEHRRRAQAYEQYYRQAHEQAQAQYRQAAHEQQYRHHHAGHGRMSGQDVFEALFEEFARNGGNGYDDADIYEQEQGYHGQYREYDQYETSDQYDTSDHHHQHRSQQQQVNKSKSPQSKILSSTKIYPFFFTHHYHHHHHHHHHQSQQQ